MPVFWYFKIMCLMRNSTWRNNQVQSKRSFIIKQGGEGWCENEELKWNTWKIYWQFNIKLKSYSSSQAVLPRHKGPECKKTNLVSSNIDTGKTVILWLWF